MIHPLHDTLHPAATVGRGSQLEAAITASLLDCNLKAGDRLPGPDELARRFGMLQSEVLEVITRMLAQRILRQDLKGNLYIHAQAEPTLEMRQQAFLMRARNLLDLARKWQLPSAAIQPLIERATRQVA